MSQSSTLTNALRELSFFLSFFLSSFVFVTFSPMIRETRVRFQVASYQRLLKWYLIPPCLTLSNIRYVSRVAIQGKEWRPPLHLGVVAIEKGAFWLLSTKIANLTLIYIYMYIYIYIYICIYIYEVHTISFHTFCVWALLLIVHTWNSSHLRSCLLRLQCTCCIVPTTSGRHHGCLLVWACQWPSSQPLLSS